MRRDFALLVLASTLYAAALQCQTSPTLPPPPGGVGPTGADASCAPTASCDSGTGATHDAAEAGPTEAGNVVDGTTPPPTDGGALTFAPPITTPTSGGNGILVATDLNGDGKTDLIVSGYNQPTIVALLGSGDGHFGSPVTTTPMFPPSPSGLPGNGNVKTIAAADLNGDKKADLLVAVNTSSGTTSFAAFLGNGDGTFGTAMPIEQGPQSVAPADMNGDGKMDLVLATLEVTVLLGNGDGTFGVAQSFSVGDPSWSPLVVAVADTNGDKKPDVLVDCAGGLASDAALFYLGYFQVFLGNGDGTLQTPTTTPIGNDPDEIAPGDFTGSGSTDVAVLANYDTSHDPLVDVLLNDGGTLSPPTAIHPPANAALAAGDLNGDRKADLVVATGAAASGAGPAVGAYVYLAQTGGAFATPQLVPLGTGGDALVVADFNGDGLPDIAVTGPDPVVSVALNTSK